MRLRSLLPAAAFCLLFAGCSPPASQQPPAPPQPLPVVTPAPNPKPTASNEAAALPAVHAPLPAGPAEPGTEGANAAVAITFDDLLLGLKPDTVFNYTQLTDRARELDGKVVTIRGFMEGGLTQSEDIREFILLRQEGCLYGPGAVADHVVAVRMQGDARARYKMTPTTVTGTFRIRPRPGFDGNTWSIYVIEARRAE